jgi:hypothetical protein
MFGPCVTAPSIRPLVAPPAGLPGIPTVVEPLGAPPPVAAPGEPEELAVPAEFVPGWLGAFAALPPSAGSLPVLKPPAGLAGPVTPLMAVVPAPGEPALGAAVTPRLHRRQPRRRSTRRHFLPHHHRRRSVKEPVSGSSVSGRDQDLQGI